MFLTTDTDLDTDSRGSVVESVILGVDVNCVTNSSVMNTNSGEIQLAFQQFRMVCGVRDSYHQYNNPHDLVTKICIQQCNKL